MPDGVPGGEGGRRPVAFLLVCLLVVLSRVVPGLPLVVAANRDERLDRPATAWTVLRAASPLVVGGRDEVAGGTWLAVNEHGVVAGLTNRPMEGGRDPAKRSRGELPLLAAVPGHTGRVAASLVAAIEGDDYNPCWMLVGDRQGLWAVEVGGPGRQAVERLPPGVHILENRPLSAPSSKVDRVRHLLDEAGVWQAAAEAERRAPGPGGAGATALVGALRAVLADHRVPGGDPDGPMPGDWRPAAVSACCVHTPEYGTRSATVVLVPDGDGPAAVHVADGPPCTAPLVDVSDLWGAHRQ